MRFCNNPETIEGVRNDFDALRGGPFVMRKGRQNYYYSGNCHVLVDGMTQSGKTVSATIPFIKNTIRAGESFISVDPKGEIFRMTGALAGEKHNVIVIDLANPEKSRDSINLLGIFCNMYKSKNISVREKGEKEFYDFSTALYPREESKDTFWPVSAAELFRGVGYLLFEHAEKEEEINLRSLCEILAGESGTRTNLMNIQEHLPDTSRAKKDLKTYKSAASDTRASILVSALGGIAVFKSSSCLTDMLSSSTFDLEKLDIDKKPLAFYIILPAYSKAYDPIAGLIINVLINHFLELSVNKYSGSLPGRLSIVIEEAGTVSGTIRNLPSYISSVLGNNMRFFLVAQNARSQFAGIFNTSGAETIMSAIGMNIIFKNTLDSLAYYSRQFGTVSDGKGGQIPVLTENQLASLRTGQYAVIINNEHRFVTHFSSACSEDAEAPEFSMRRRGKVIIFSPEKFLRNLIEKKRAALEPSGSPDFSSYLTDRDRKFAEDMKKIEESIRRIDEEEKKKDENKKEESVKEKKGKNGKGEKAGKKDTGAGKEGGKAGKDKPEKDKPDKDKPEDN